MIIRRIEAVSAFYGCLSCKESDESESKALQNKPLTDCFIVSGWRWRGFIDMYADVLCFIKMGYAHTDSQQKHLIPFTHVLKGFEKGKRFKWHLHSLYSKLSLHPKDIATPSKAATATTNDHAIPSKAATATTATANTNTNSKLNKEELEERKDGDDIYNPSSPELNLYYGGRKKTTRYSTAEITCILNWLLINPPDDVKSMAKAVVGLPGHLYDNGYVVRTTAGLSYVIKKIRAKTHGIVKNDVSLKQLVGKVNKKIEATNVSKFGVSKSGKEEVISAMKKVRDKHAVESDPLSEYHATYNKKEKHRINYKKDTLNNSREAVEAMKGANAAIQKLAKSDDEYMAEAEEIVYGMTGKNKTERNQLLSVIEDHPKGFIRLMKLASAKGYSDEKVKERLMQLFERYLE
eukprot:805228_1